MKSAKLATKRTLRTSKRFTASIAIPSEGGNRADKEDRSSGAPRLPCGGSPPKALLSTGERFCAVQGSAPAASPSLARCHLGPSAKPKPLSLDRSALAQ